MAVQRLVGGGLVGVHIQTGSADLAGLQRSQQSGLVHIGAAGGVDDHHAVLHLGDVLRRDQRTAVHSGRVDGYEVRLGQQLVHLHIGDAQLLLDAGDVENIEGDDVHADGLGHDAQMLADAAKAHDAQGLALQLDALAVLLLLPLAVAHGVAGIGDVAGAGEHVAHGQLRHGLGGRPGGVFHGDAIGLGVLHVDVIHAYAAADDQLQLAALGLVDVVGADLGLGANHHHVEIAQGLAQLIRLVELLHHLVTHLAQLRHRGLVHTVSNQNTHGNILLYYYNLLIFAGAGRWGRPPLHRPAGGCLPRRVCGRNTTAQPLRAAPVTEISRWEGLNIPFAGCYFVCSASNFFRNSTSASAPSMGMALYTEARRPPTDLWPFRLS